MSFNLTLQCELDPPNTITIDDDLIGGRFEIVIEEYGTYVSVVLSRGTMYNLMRALQQEFREG